jgi:sterol desaturase/sphingolipid hydroxylase (fatty acid hydroxylase superfamily)
MSFEVLIRLAVFLGLLVLIALVEALLPKRARVRPRAKRWFTNLTMAGLDALALRAVAVLLPFLAVGAAVDAWSQGMGLFNHLRWPLLAEIGLSLLVLDFAIWLQHLITHKVPLFWRFHRVHHADLDMDVTTAVRFHPVEILASMAVKIGVVYLLGPQAVAVLLFEILLNATALFNHANIALPRGLDWVLRLVLVTPDMHRVHHSVIRAEHDSNFGFALSIWDRIFGTYRGAPAGGHDAMTVGLEWQDDKPTKLGWSLMLPFRR